MTDQVEMTGCVTRTRKPFLRYRWAVTQEGIVVAAGRTLTRNGAWAAANSVARMVTRKKSSPHPDTETHIYHPEFGEFK